MHVVIASKNPVKIDATKAAFLKMFPSEEFSFEGVSVSSGANDQPMSDEETLLGAETRVKNARDMQPEAEYWVGLEGGVGERGTDLEAFAWMVVVAKTGLKGSGRTASFILPKEVAKLIRDGIELGVADDIVFKRSNSKQENGAVGLLTDNVVTRTSYYEQAMILALIPHKNTSLYD